MKKNFLCLIMLFNSHVFMQAQVVLPKIFAHNMVLQRNVLIPIWGKAKPNETLEIRFNQQIKKTKADKNGAWSLKLDAETAGGPYQLAIYATDTVVLKNVLVGEVWICSGQSNMEWSVAQSLNAKKEMAKANNPFIRHIKIDHLVSSLPETDIKMGIWDVCDTSSVGFFTGVGYFFAKNLYDELKIPIGLINSSWGGTNIETWISRDAFERSDEFKEMIAKMPKVHLDSLSALRIGSLRKRIETLQGAKLPTNTDNFKELSFDDSKWIEINQPEIWEQQSIGELDGVVWLRKTFNLSEAESKQKAMLELSKIDDNDISYVNGVKVGNMDYWEAKRNYAIPAGLLKAGKNVIAVRVVDNGGGGGIFGDSNDLKLNLETTAIPLNGAWKCQVESIKKAIDQNSMPSLCYNAMINPLIPYAFKGVLWYQGESNASRAVQYKKAFPLLINDWRQKWQQGNFPFYFVQLATFNTTGNSNEGCEWAELREAQTQTLNLPNTGMCVTTDVGNPFDIHPTDKQTVSKRLAALALNNTYNIPVVCNSPTFKSMTVKDNQVIVSFDNIGGGIVSPDKYGYIKGFEIAGDDHVFYYAKAFIQDNTVVLYNDNVKKPVAVHFGWMGDASDCNVFNKEGFPLIPFRTDDWKTASKNGKYEISIGEK